MKDSGFTDVKDASPEQLEQMMLAWENAIREGSLDQIREARTAQQIAEIKVYRLHRWLEHKPGCPRRIRSRFFHRRLSTKDCNCGLDETLRQVVYPRA